MRTLLDLFARAQGTSVGYARAGFTVTASDINPYPKHPEIEGWITADALEILSDIEFCRSFDVITASPPCQAYTLAPVSDRASRPRLIATVRAGLELIGRPYVIENVVSKSSRAEMYDPIVLCGTMFGLGATGRDGEYRNLRRHRYFDSNVPMRPPPPCSHSARGGRTIGVYGHGGTSPGKRGYAGAKSESGVAMGIDWMCRDDLSQAIPPAYTEWIGRQLLDHLDL